MRAYVYVCARCFVLHAVPRDGGLPRHPVLRLLHHSAFSLIFGSLSPRRPRATCRLRTTGMWRRLGPVGPATSDVPASITYNVLIKHLLEYSWEGRLWPLKFNVRGIYMRPNNGAKKCVSFANGTPRLVKTLHFICYHYIDRLWCGSAFWHVGWKTTTWLS